MTSMMAVDDGCIVDTTQCQDPSLAANEFGIGPSSRARLHVFARKPRQTVKPPPGPIRLLSWSKTKPKDDSPFVQHPKVSPFSSTLPSKPKQSTTKRGHSTSKLTRRASHDAALVAFHRDKASMCHSHAIDPLFIHVGVASAQGTREYMEDRHVVTHDLFQDAALIAVFDGHNGAWAAEFASSRMGPLLAANDQLRRHATERPLTADAVEEVYAILTAAFLTLDDEILAHTVAHGQRDGATAALVLVFQDMVFAANAGDSRVVLVRRGHPSTNAHGVERLSVDHKPDVAAEKARIVTAGGSVVFSGCWRVSHPKSTLRLAVSRSLGDHPLKIVAGSPALVSAVPHIRHFSRTEGDVVVVASDGLWDRVTDADAMHHVVGALVAPVDLPNAPSTSHRVMQSAAGLVELALARRTADNVTVAVVAL